MIESWQHGLNQRAEEDMEVKSKCAPFKEGGANANCNSHQELRTLLQISNALFSSFSSEQKKDFLCLKNLTATGETVSNKEIQKILKQDTYVNSDEKKRS
eukprot:4998979-Ditylum_brightwellii.AAC.1